LLKTSKLKGVSRKSHFKGEIDLRGGGSTRGEKQLEEQEREPQTPGLIQMTGKKKATQERRITKEVAE